MLKGPLQRGKRKLCPSVFLANCHLLTPALFSKHNHVSIRLTRPTGRTAPGELSHPRSFPTPEMFDILPNMNYPCLAARSQCLLDVGSSTGDELHRPALFHPNGRNVPSLFSYILYAWTCIYKFFCFLSSARKYQFEDKHFNTQRGFALCHLGTATISGLP